MISNSYLIGLKEWKR